MIYLHEEMGRNREQRKENRWIKQIDTDKEQEIDERKLQRQKKQQTTMEGHNNSLIRNDKIKKNIFYFSHTY